MGGFRAGLGGAQLTRRRSAAALFVRSLPSTAKRQLWQPPPHAVKEHAAAEQREAQQHGDDEWCERLGHSVRGPVAPCGERKPKRSGDRDDRNAAREGQAAKACVLPPDRLGEDAERQRPGVEYDENHTCTEEKY